MENMQAKIEALGHMMYAHEKDALNRWSTILERGVGYHDAKIYYDACHVILTTVRLRIEEEEKKRNFKLHVVE